MTIEKSQVATRPKKMTNETEKNDVGNDQHKEKPKGDDSPSKDDPIITNKDATPENDQPNQTETALSKDAAAKRQKKIRRLVRFLLIFPYIAGMVWTCLHPIVSVITGEMKCRGWYLDEHSIETRFTAGQKSQLVPDHLKDLESILPLRSNPNAPHSLCDFFAREGDPGFNIHNLVCLKHGDYFEMAVIMPLSNALAATEEAVVLVVPRPSDVYPSKDTNVDWNSSTYHRAVVQSIYHLANPVDTPWLAKTVLVVTPTANSEKSLDETVSSFLDAYLGRQTLSQDYHQRMHQEPDEGFVPQLPTRFSGAIVRNLVVFEVQDKSVVGKRGASRTTDLAVLPQGRRGVLPNADLVFLVGKLMDRTTFFTKAESKTFLTHPYKEESATFKSKIHRWIRNSDFLNSNPALGKRAKPWANGMTDILLFARTLAVGPYPPHAAALERGMDSLTIRASFEGTYHRDPTVELVQHSEYIVRSLANLHERLHHSFTLYLLPTPRQFVSHIEYLLPNILLVLPLAVRVFGICLPNMRGGLDLTALVGVLLTVLVVAGVMVVSSAVSGDEASFEVAAVYTVLYIGVAIYWVRKILQRNRHTRCAVPKSSEEKDHDPSPETTRTILALQLVTCAITVYILVPIAFAHASLSYLPSLLWTPLLAFPNYPSLKRSHSKGVIHKLIVLPILCLLVVITAPPVWIVPRMISTYTPFIRYAYTPIHVLFFLLVSSTIIS